MANETTSETLAALSIEQKAALCIGSDFWHTTAVPEHNIEALLVTDGPHGLRRQPDDGDHVGIGGSLPATCFPTASALGSSWDPALVREVGQAIGVEARAQGVAVVLGPGVNIKRSPLCGRNFEYVSEDPHVAGRIGAALVEGIQSQQVGGSVKHFAANNQETDRIRVSAEVDERTLREIYLPAFEYIITTARPWTVMCSYNKLNGTYASQHRWLLTDVLRDEWGFDGVVVSDWGAVHDRVGALAAGLDLEMPPNLGVSDRAVVEAVRSGQLDIAALDRTSARMLALLERSRQRQPAESDAAAHHALARRAAAESIVLLKNEGVLPLVDDAELRVLLVGEFARTMRFQGAGSSQVNPTRIDVLLDELASLLPSSRITFAPDADAAESALHADVVVACIGLSPEDESEGYDRTHIDLPVAQVELVHALAATGRPVVVALINGSAVRVSDWADEVDAIVECWLAGQATAGALADILSGQINPSGKLTETIPRRLADNSAYLNFPGEQGHVRYGEGVFVGYRGYDAQQVDVSYPFGHGLSYTDFDYADLSVDLAGSVTDGDLRITVSCTVTNAGDRIGAEVVQLYVGDPVASVARPPRELRAFRKLQVAPGRAERVEFRLVERDLSFWSSSHGRWLAEPGQFVIEVGASSRDIRLRTVIDLDGPPAGLPLTDSSTLLEWLADPVGRERLHAAVGVDANGRPNGILGQPAMAAMIGNFPLPSLVVFPGLGITHDVVESLLPRQ
ncbi:MAG: glycoside hydrolase family 3 C-terminal domain-containing protein [Actinobacteria bacterium]|nr:glycoside hydrolase family 3 C-terminal domain-containing protein [Actinomycetota bacterium]